MFNDTEHETGLDISDTFPPNEIDEDAAIIKADLQKIIRYSTKLNDRINDGDSIDGWIQAKIVKAADYIASVYHYFEFEMELNHVGQKIENSDFYTEDQKAILRAKLIEGRSILAELKIKTAQKLSELTETPKSVKFGRKRKRLGAPSFKTASRKKATGLRKFKKFTSSSVEESASVASTSSSDIPVTTQKMVPTQKAASAFWNTVKQEAKDALDNQKPSTGSDDVFYGENEQPLKQDEVQKMLSTLTKPKHDPTLGMAKPYTHAPLAPSPAKPKPASTTPSNTNLLEDANNALSDIRTLAGVK